MMKNGKTAAHNNNNIYQDNEVMTYCDVTMTVCYSNTVQVNKVL